MSSRRLLWLLLLAACDDDATLPPDALPDAATGELIVDAGLDASAETPDSASPAQEDATIADADVSDASHDASANDAGASASEDAGADASEDAGALDCASLGLTYDNYGAEFMYLWCLSCHAKTEPQLDTPEQIQLWLPAIYSESVASKRMPPGGNAIYLRDNQRAEFGRWLDCGAP